MAQSKPSKPTIRVVSAAIRHNGRYLITQRQRSAILPLLWEFPGGRVETGESDENALKRELVERLGLDAHVNEQISRTEREYDKYLVELSLYACDLGSMEPKPMRVNDLRWVTPAEFEDFDFTPADQQSMDALLFGSKKQGHN